MASATIICIFLDKTDNSPRLGMKQQLGGYNALWMRWSHMPKFSSLWLVASLTEGLTEGVMSLFSNNYSAKYILFSFLAPFMIIFNKYEMNLRKMHLYPKLDWSPKLELYSWFIQLNIVLP